MVFFQLLIACVLIGPMTTQLHANLAQSRSIRWIFLQLRDPILVATLAIADCLFGLMAIHVLVFPCIWGPFLPLLETGQTIHLAMLVLGFSGSILAASAVAESMQLWLQVRAHPVLLSWVLAIGYYIGVYWVAAQFHRLMHGAAMNPLLANTLRHLLELSDSGREIELLTFVATSWILAYLATTYLLGSMIANYGLKDASTA
jgi:hypothetical protein